MKQQQCIQRPVGATNQIEGPNERRHVLVIEQTNNAYPSYGNLAAAILCQLFEELLWVFVRVSPNIECSFFQVYLLCNL